MPCAVVAFPEVQMISMVMATSTFDCTGQASVFQPTLSRSTSFFPCFCTSLLDWRGPGIWSLHWWTHKASTSWTWLSPVWCCWHSWLFTCSSSDLVTQISSAHTTSAHLLIWSISGVFCRWTSSGRMHLMWSLWASETSMSKPQLKCGSYGSSVEAMPCLAHRSRLYGFTFIKGLFFWGIRIPDLQEPIVVFLLHFLSWCLHGPCLLGLAESDTCAGYSSRAH